MQPRDLVHPGGQLGGRLPLRRVQGPAGVDGVEELLHDVGPHVRVVRGTRGADAGIDQLSEEAVAAQTEERLGAVRAELPQEDAKRPTALKL